MNRLTNCLDAAPFALDRRLRAAAARDRMRDRGGAPVPNVPRTVKGHAIAPYALHEECMKARVPGDRLEYHFYRRRAAAISNIHYHEGKAVGACRFRRDGVRGKGGLLGASSPRSRRITA